MICRRLYIAMFLCSLLAVCSIAAYYYVMDGMPKKLPARAKQVLVLPQNDKQGYTNWYSCFFMMH